MRFEQVLQENLQLNAQLENLRAELRNIGEHLGSERDRNAALEERIGELQREINYCKSPCNVEMIDTRGRNLTSCCRGDKVQRSQP